ncbi:hypothetical protein [Gelidibacter mesophilus]|uniref:hypothetical protein n=1 Tax=Gelidibacter mesophilus TaxID=169050 RepID=UPI0003F73557|nr:hypothetical protein [Gelidibacter mesophilus]
MNKPILIALLTLLILSCADINQTENKITEIENLRAENDSLKKIVSELNNKYVFDSIFVKTTNDPDNSKKLNSDYKMDIMIVAYNSDKSYLVAYDKEKENKINLDTIKHRKGIYKYETKLTDDLKEVFIDLHIENDYGQKIMGTLRDRIKIKN